MYVSTVLAVNFDRWLKPCLRGHLGAIGGTERLVLPRLDGGARLAAGPVLLALVAVQPDHCLAKILGHGAENLRVLVMRDGLDNRGRALGRVAGLEDPGTDEHTVHTKLHHQRGVSRRCNTTGSKVDDRKAAHLLGLLD